MDEKWSFVFKKRGHSCPEELQQEGVGDCWDHIAFDPEHRLMLGVKASPVSTKVNTSFIERHNATDRHRNARKS